MPCGHGWAGNGPGNREMPTTQHLAEAMAARLAQRFKEQGVDPAKATKAMKKGLPDRRAERWR